MPPAITANLCQAGTGLLAAALIGGAIWDGGPVLAAPSPPSASGGLLSQTQPLPGSVMADPASSAAPGLGSATATPPRVHLMIAVANAEAYERVMALLHDARLTAMEGEAFLVVGSFADARMAHALGVALQRRLRLPFELVYDPLHPQADLAWIHTPAAGPGRTPATEPGVVVSKGAAAPIRTARQAAPGPQAAPSQPLPAGDAPSDALATLTPRPNASAPDQSPARPQLLRGPGVAIGTANLPAASPNAAVRLRMRVAPEALQVSSAAKGQAGRTSGARDPAAVPAPALPVASAWPHGGQLRSPQAPYAPGPRPVTRERPVIWRRAGALRRVRHGSRASGRHGHRLAGLLLLGGLGLISATLPAWASSFDVFCTDNSDGTRTCLGWEGGEALTCIRSQGSTISCSTPSGRSFTCSQTLGGVLSCSPPPSGRARGGPRCVPTGDGNLFCDEEDQPSPELITPPSVPGALEPLDAPALRPVLPGGLRIPSVFD